MTFSRAILFCTQFSHSQLYKNAEMEITSNEIVTHPCRSTRNSIVNPRYSTKESIHDQHGEFFFFHTQSQVKNATEYKAINELSLIRYKSIVIISGITYMNIMLFLEDFSSASKAMRVAATGD